MSTHVSHSNSSDHHPHVVSVQTNLIIFALLMVLLVLTVVAAYTITGTWGIIVAMIIATVKAILILAYFMHVRFGSKLQFLFAVAAFFWLGLMILITLMDYSSRGWLGIGGK